MLNKWIRVRIILVGIGLGIFFLAVLARIVDLKFIQGPFSGGDGRTRASEELPRLADSRHHHGPQPYRVGY